MERILWKHSEVFLIVFYNYPGRVIGRTLQLFPLLGKMGNFCEFLENFLSQKSIWSWPHGTNPLKIFRGLSYSIIQLSWPCNRRTIQLFPLLGKNGQFLWFLENFLSQKSKKIFSCQTPLNGLKRGEN